MAWTKTNQLDLKQFHNSKTNDDNNKNDNKKKNNLKMLQQLGEKIQGS